MPTTDNRSWTLTKLQIFVGQVKSWVSGKVKNNLTTTTAGDMLDATQGKVLDEKITDTAKLSGIVEDGTTATHAIAKGQFVVWQRALYTADAAISVGETLAATGGSKNLTAVSDGGLNALNASFVVVPFSGTTTPTNRWQVPSPYTPSNYVMLAVEITNQPSFCFWDIESGSYQLMPYSPGNPPSAYGETSIAGNMFLRKLP